MNVITIPQTYRGTFLLSMLPCHVFTMNPVNSLPSSELVTPDSF